MTSNCRKFGYRGMLKVIKYIIRFDLKGYNNQKCSNLHLISGNIFRDDIFGLPKEVNHRLRMAFEAFFNRKGYMYNTY